MRTRSRIASLAFLLSITVVAVPAVPASAGGGGCHPAPGGGGTEGTGTTVAMENMCMSPTVLRVEPGATVTFVNRDPLVHNVYGLGWGHDELRQGASAAMTFEKAGTYPYACTLHPGMVGAVVVGDGRGGGEVTRVSVAAPVAAAPAAATRTADGGGSSSWVVALVAGVVLGGGAVAALVSRGGRRRATTTGR